jgi:hypothetical protein
VRSDQIKVAGRMALTIIRKETAMIEKVVAMSFGLALAEPSDISIHHQKIGNGSERRYLVVIAD